MSLDEAFNIAGAVLASLGGGALIIGAFAHFLGKLWANRLIETKKKELEKDLERYKSELRRSDFLFQKEFDAVNGFLALNRNFSPKYLNQNMDWNDACEQTAGNLHLIEEALERYVSAHGAILTKSVRTDISRCMAIAGEQKFNLDEHDLSEDVGRCVGDLLNIMQNIERELTEKFISHNETK